MEFLVEFAIRVPDGVSQNEVDERKRAEASVAAKLARDGHVERIWNRAAADGAPSVLGLYRAEDATQLDQVLRELPLRDWMDVVVTPLEDHPNDPAAAELDVYGRREAGDALPAPRLTFVYRLEATLGSVVDLGDTPQGRRRVAPLTGGTFTGPSMSGILLPGASADWQIVEADGTTRADLRYTLETSGGVVLYVSGSGVRHGSTDVLARLARGDDVDPSQYTFRTATRIETGDPELGWVNQGVFISVGGRHPSRVIYETYLVA